VIMQKPELLDQPAYSKHAPCIRFLLMNNYKLPQSCPWDHGPCMWFYFCFGNSDHQMLNMLSRINKS
jgi:hypothetical protein